MPPKAYRRPKPNSQSGSQQSRSNLKEISQKQREEFFINPRHVMQNTKILDRVRILVSLLAGVISGILNATQLQGPAVYLGLQLLCTFLIWVGVPKVDSFFMKKTDIASGFASGILLFVCAWMIVHNIVYTL